MADLPKEWEAIVEAGLEAACNKLAELGQGGLVQTIRAMKGEAK